MGRIREQIRRFLVIFLTIFFVSSIFSTAFSKAPVEDFAVAESEEGDEGEEGEEEEEHEPTEEELAAAQAALDKKTEKLIEEVKKIGNNSSAIIEGLLKDENQDALDNSAELLEKLVGALLNDKKQNYSDLENYGQKLCNKDKKSALGNLALGLGLMNKKKPNLKRAMECLSIAKSAKNPHPNASSAYLSCLMKRFGLYIFLGIAAAIGIPIGIIIKKKKAKKTEEVSQNAEVSDDGENINLQQLLNEGPDLSGNSDSSAELNMLNNADSLQNTSLNKDLNVSEPAKPQEQPVLDIKSPEINNIKNNEAPVNQIQKEKAEAKPSAPTANSNSSSVASTSVPATDSSTQTTTATAPAKKIVRVVKKVRVRKDSEGNSYVVSESPATSSSSESDYSNNTVNRADLEAVKTISRPKEKPLPPIDTQLDILWGNLSRKAMQGHIGLMARKADALPNALGPTNSGGGPVYSGGYSSDNRVTDIRLGDVSIDLSEEALKDDLVGKLKMLAITDAELRELFAMKNPAHIPHLIEYIMTKPEPMRLAFVAKEIGNYGDPAVVDTLASLLYHEDERVVLAAIQGLEATKSPAAVIPLCPFLRSEIPLYAQAARTALSKFGAVKIMQALKDLPTFTDIKLKEAGIFVLSRMKGDPVEKILKTLLNDESSSVRIQTILAMSYQKNPVYIDPLREFYRIANETEKSMTRKAIVYLNGFNK
jgi:HEAT repeat protein